MNARRVRFTLAACALLALASLLPLPRQALGQSSGLASTLGSLAEEAGLGERVSVTVADAATGRRVFALRPELALNPASNQKLVTAAAALHLLGADMRFRTGLYGRVEGSAIVGGLTIRGMGDPSLEQADLVELARDLQRRGVRTVDGIIVDATYFDGQTLPPAFDQQPSEVSAFRATTGAVSVDANAYLLRVRPGDSVGAPARVELDGEGYFLLDNRITTSEGGTPNVVADQREEGEQMRLRLSGQIPLGSARLTYRRRIENPLPWSGYVLRDALAAVGIRVSGGVQVATRATQAPLLTAHTSRPLSELITPMGKQSDNFVAEMIFRALGAERHQPGRVEDSIAAVRAFLSDVGVEGEPAIVNGSGLFDGNLISSGQLTQILVFAYRSPAISSEYQAHLAIGGVDGTLARRLRDLPAPRIVRAKTGTLNDAIALSGYVLGPTPGRAYAFSVLVNGARGRQSAARVFADAIVRALAEDLHRAER